MRNSKIKIVIDTNIFIRTLIFTGRYKECDKAFDYVLDMVENNKAELVFSQETIGELIYVIKYKSNHNIKDFNNRVQVMNYISTLFLESYSVNTENTKDVECKDERDIMFAKCAIQSRASFFISDDFKHGLHDNDLLSFNVVSSEDFVIWYENEYKDKIV